MPGRLSRRFTSARVATLSCMATDSPRRALLSRPWPPLLAVLLFGALPGCHAGVGPVIGYASGRGAVYGWELSGGAGPLRGSVGGSYRPRPEEDEEEEEELDLDEPIDGPADGEFDLDEPIDEVEDDPDGYMFLDGPIDDRHDAHVFLDGPGHGPAKVSIGEAVKDAPPAGDATASGALAPAPELVPPEGAPRSAQDEMESVHYVALEPWLFVGGTLGASFSEQRGVDPMVGFWEGAPIPIAGKCGSGDRVKPIVSIAVGGRWLGGTHEVYLTPKVGVMECIGPLFF